MSRKLQVAQFCVSVLACLFVFGAAQAQGRPGGAPLITQRIDEGKLIVLGGTTSHHVTPQNDRGPLPDNFMLQHMMLQLRRSTAQESALQQFIDELNTEGSPNFHRWMTAQQFGQN